MIADRSDHRQPGRDERLRPSRENVIEAAASQLLHEVTIRFDLGELVVRLAGAISERLETTPTSPWLGVQGAAEHLSCSEERIRKLIATRRIPFHQERAGGRVFLNRRELDEWLLNL